MLDYIFFHQIPFDRFVAFLEEKGVRPETESSDDGFEVRVSEDLDDALSDEIEGRYDELMALNQELCDSEQSQDADDYHAAGVVLNLKDGSTVYADVDSRLLVRVMEVLTAGEFGQLVNAIVAAVEEPDSRSLCQRGRDGGTGEGPAG